MKLIEKAKAKTKTNKLEESGKISIGVVYVSGIDSISKQYTEKNYDDIEEIEASLESAFGSDDYWIDDVWVDGPKLNLNWKEILTNGSRMNLELVNLIFEEDAEELFIKMEFCNQMKYDIDESRLESIMIYDGKRDNLIEGNFGDMYPEGFVDEYVDNNHSDIVKALEKINAAGYMNWASVVSDAEANGAFSGTTIDGYFVYTYDI